MVIATTPLAFVTAVGSVLVTGVLVGLLWRRRDRPTAWALLGVAAVLTVVAGTHLALVHLAPTRAAVASVGALPPAGALDTTVVSIGFLIAFGLWAVFAFDYTGRGGSARTAVRGLVTFVVTVPVLTLAASLPGLLSVAVTNAVYTAGLIAANVLAVVGVFQIVDESTRVGPLPQREAFAMAAAVGVLVSGPLAYFAVSETFGVAVPVLAGGLLFVGVLWYGTPLSTLPAASVVGRDRVITEMSDGVFVVGQDGQVQDANPAVGALLDVDHETVVGTGWSTVFPDAPGLERVAESTRPVELKRDETVVAATASAVTDRQGRRLGHLVVCQDVTARRERERRLGVLSQFLVDIAFDGMEGLVDRADRLADGVDDSERRRRLGDEVWTTTTDLVTLVAYARDIERALADAHERGSDVDAVLHRAVAEAAPDGVTPAVDAGESDARAAVAPSLLVPVIRLLATEVVDAPLRRLTVTAHADEGTTLTITIADDGDDTDGDRSGEAPVVGDHDRAVADGVDTTVAPAETTSRDDSADATEMATRLARVGVESVGGTVTVDRSADGVETARIRVPATAAPTDTPPADDRTEVSDP